MKFIDAAKNKKMGVIRKMKNYYEHYDFHFSKLDRKKKYRILEIGVKNGGGLWTLKKYFPNSSITGLDILDCLQYGSNEDDVQVFVGDQTDLDMLDKLHKDRGPFDIIIDDGGHMMEQQISSFMHLFQLLATGGIYIVEDLHTSYWPKFGGGISFFGQAKEDTMMNCLKLLTDKSTARWASRFDRAIPYFNTNDFDYCDRYIESIHYHDSMCFIYKNYFDVNEVGSQYYKNLMISI